MARTGPRRSASCSENLDPSIDANTNCGAFVPAVSAAIVLFPPNKLLSHFIGRPRNTSLDDFSATEDFSRQTGQRDCVQLRKLDPAASTRDNIAAHNFNFEIRYRDRMLHRE